MPLFRLRFPAYRMRLQLSHTEAECQKRQKHKKQEGDDIRLYPTDAEASTELNEQQRGQDAERHAGIRHQRGRRRDIATDTDEYADARGQQRAYEGQQKEKLNELVSAIHEKDELLDSQEDFLIKENKKHVKVKNAYVLEIEKCEKLSSELSTCHDIITNLRNENAKLIAKDENLDVCDDSLVSLRNDNASLITKIDKLNASLSSLKIEN